MDIERKKKSSPKVITFIAKFRAQSQQQSEYRFTMISTNNYSSVREG